MKKNICFLPLIILMSCSQTKQDSIGAVSQETVNKAIKSDNTLQSIINANIHKQPLIDTVFLDFAFSMTKEQAIAHFNQLIKKKKLVLNEQDRHYQYPMTFDLVKANATIAPEFQDNKLYKLSLIITPADDTGTGQTVYLQTATTYMKKYSGYNLFQEPDLIEPSEKKFHWIKNNLHIFLRKTIEGSVVSYINMPAEQLIDKRNSKETDSTKAQTNKDI